VTKLGSILDQIDSGTVLLPEFQRGYVWNRDQVRGLMRSLYLGYPVGGLLVWETEPTAGAVRGASDGVDGVKQLLLDGQQRVTTLYGIARGKPPSFFEGDANAFSGLRFHLKDEVFEFYAPAKMKDDPLWVDVTELFVEGLQPHIVRLNSDPEARSNFGMYMARLVTLHGLLEREFHSEKITGADKSVDTVVDIFNRVNSGGTKLSKGDLALAKVCADWPEARATLRNHLVHWTTAKYDLKLDWFLRNINAVATGKAPFAALEAVTTEKFQSALASSANYVGAFLDLAAARLGLDHDRVLMGRYAVPVISRWQHVNGGSIGDSATQNKILYWYVHAALWGRHTGSTETVLAQDYDTVQEHGVDGLISALERWRGGNLTITPHDFKSFGRGSRFYPLLYLMTRVGGARDFGNGIELKRQLLGHLTSLQVHHIFPKAQLYRAGYGRGDVNAVANFCFLTQQTNLDIGMRRPEDYFTEIEATHPGALESQWIPADRRLWKLENYLQFLEARRELLAEAANDFLSKLRAGQTTPSSEPLPRIVVEDAGAEDDLGEVRKLAAELQDLGFARPEFDVEIADPEIGAVLAVAEAYWEQGLQAGIGAPVVLELDPDEANIARMEELGFDVFTTLESLRGNAKRRAREAAGDLRSSDPAADIGDPAGESSAVAVVVASDEALRRRFDRAMQEVYVRAKKEAGYTASYYLEMLHRHGGLETARRLLATPAVSDGFVALWERGRMDLTVENVVLLEEFEQLFSDEERETARQRLREYGVDISGRP
jgi:hypothetical protein